MTSVIRALADFGDASDSRLLPVLPPPGTTPEMTVLLYDDEGNSCTGYVERVEDSIAWVCPAWKTWVPSRQDTGSNQASDIWRRVVFTGLASQSPSQGFGVATRLPDLYPVPG